MGERHGSRWSRRAHQARDRRRGPRDIRLRFAADRGSRQPASGRIARRRRHQGLRRRPQDAEDGRGRDRRGRPRRPRARRLARAASPRPAAAGGQPRSQAPRPLWHVDRSLCSKWSRRRASGRFAGKIFEGPRRFDLMLLQPPASPGPAGSGRASGRSARRAAGSRLRRRDAFAIRRARPSSTASRSSAGCWSR